MSSMAGELHVFPGLLCQMTSKSSIAEDHQAFYSRRPPGLLWQTTSTSSMAKDLHVVYGRRLPRLLWQKTSRSSIVDHLHVFYGKRIKGRFLAEDLKFSVKGGLQVIYSRRPSCLLWEKISRFLWPKTSESEEDLQIFYRKLYPSLLQQKTFRLWTYIPYSSYC